MCACSFLVHSSMKRTAKKRLINFWVQNDNLQSKHKPTHTYDWAAVVILLKTKSPCLNGSLCLIDWHISNRRNLYAWRSRNRNRFNPIFRQRAIFNNKAHNESGSITYFKQKKHRNTNDRQTLAQIRIVFAFIINKGIPLIFPRQTWTKKKIDKNKLVYFFSYVANAIIFFAWICTNHSAGQVHQKWPQQVSPVRIRYIADIIRN